MLQNINCASPVAASTATRTLGRSARTSCPCETLASSNRSRSLKDCDCAVMRASIGHLLLNVVVRLVAGGGSAAEVECFLEVVREVEYMPVAPLDELLRLTDVIIGNLFGLVRKGIHTKV